MTGRTLIHLRDARAIGAGTIALIAVAAGFAACNDSAGPDEETLRGPEVAVGAGFARTEIVVGRNGKPSSIAVVFTRNALNGLPTEPGSEYVLALPSGAPATIFDHIGINWQPQGHPPPMVYTIPHFDVHFYMISLQERGAISPADPEFAAKAVREPPAGGSPAGYSGDPFAVPNMGTHWADRNSHEFHGQTFTNTLIYGFYDGEMIFVEPMMTKAFLESLPDESKTIPVPTAVPTSGDYPTLYRAYYDEAADEFRLELGEFVAR